MKWIQQRGGFIAPGRMARGTFSNAAHEVKECYEYNGSGPSSFGGAYKWPVLKANISFQEGQEALRDELSSELRTLVTEFFIRKGLTN